MQPDEPRDPEALQVQWLEESLLVHAVTVEGGAPRRDTHLLLAGACLGAGGAAAAVVAGSVPVAAVLGVVWLGCAAGLGRRSWQVSRSVQAPARRLLVELKPGHVAWTLLAGERWSMQHDHDYPVSNVVDAVAADTALGVVVRIGLVSGESAEIPLYGLPSGDAAWLAERIRDVVAAPSEP